MKNKILILTMLISSLYWCVSFADSIPAYDLSIYVGERVSIQEDLQSVDSGFEWVKDTVIQNLNARVLSVSNNKYATGKDVGYAALLVSNGSRQVLLNYAVRSSIESIKIEDKFLSLYVGEIHDLDYEVTTLGKSTPDANQVTWTSSKTRIASIVNSNQVYTHAAGDTVLTAKTVNGQVLARLEVTVLGHSEKVKIKPQISLKQVNVGEKIQLNAYIGTKDVTKSVKWVSKTPHILTVDEDGLVTAIGEGRGSVVAETSISNKKATYDINAYSMIDRVTLNKSRIKFNGIGQTEQLNFNLYPKEKSHPPILKGFHYKSSNSKVASVSQSGLVTAEGPGLALISVIFDDSQKRGTCTVEVPVTDTYIDGNYVATKKINIRPNKYTAFIGEKVMINTSILPSNATNSEISFNIASGDNNQIRMIDGNYYFIANRRGKTRVEAKTVDGIGDDFTITVTSPIKSMDLSLSTRRVVATNTEKIFIGERAELLTRIFPRDGFDAKDIFAASLKYKIKNERIAKLLYEDNKVYIQGLKAGKVELEVVNLEGLHSETLWIEVENPIEQIKSDIEVTLPISQKYRPRVYYYTKDMHYHLDDSFNIYKHLDYMIRDVALEESFIDKEIEYENSKIAYYSNLPYSLSVRENQEKHQVRLDNLKKLKLRLIDGYASLNSETELKNRQGRAYKFYSIDSDGVTSSYPIRLAIKIKVKNTNLQVETLIAWDEDKPFNINRLGNDYGVQTLLKQYELDKVLSGRPFNEQVVLLIDYINHNEVFIKTPPYELLKSFSRVKKDKVLSELRVDKLDQVLTKDDLARVGVVLHKKYVNKEPLADARDSMYFYDVLDDELKNAIGLGYIEPIDNFYFGSDKYVTEKDFDVMLNKILSDDTKLGSNKPLTYEELILKLDRLLK